jgi:hypothetical protein
MSLPATWWLLYTMWLVKTCVWGFCVSVFETKEKASINKPIMGMTSYVRVSVDYGTCKASGNNNEYPSHKMMYPIQQSTVSGQKPPGSVFGLRLTHAIGLRLTVPTLTSMWREAKSCVSMMIKSYPSGGWGARTPAPSPP